MARRDIPMNEVVETIYQWHKGMRIQHISPPLGLDRKTVRKYLGMARSLGITQGGPLPDEQILVIKLKGQHVRAVPYGAPALDPCSLSSAKGSSMSRMVFLVVDNHPAHRARSVKTFVESVKERFHLFYLPSYSPELNPDERVWSDLKNNAIGKQCITGPDQLTKAVVGTLRSIRISPARVRSYFNNDDYKICRPRYGQL
jgi:hypothetical protein